MSKLRTMMRAVRVSQFGAPDVCQVSQIERPVAGANQVLIKTEYAGINPVDTYIRSGNYARTPDLPYTPGSDCSGTVAAVGDAVTKYKQGDSVFTVRSVSGTCAEYSVADEDRVFPMDTDNLSYKQGAGLGVPYFTAYRATFKCGQVKKGDKVLIHGASGGVGSLCIQICKHLGATVLATAGSDAGLQLAKNCSADFIYNHHSEDYAKQIMIDTDGHGVDVVIEMLANINLQRDLELLAPHGRVVVVGNRGNIEINPRLMMGKETSVMGCMLTLATTEEWVEMGEAVVRHQKEGWLQPVTSTEYTLDTVPQAHIDIIDSKGATGSLVIKT